VREEDRERACKAIQEIETDLVYRMIEAYQQNRLDLVEGSLATLSIFLDVSERVCGKTK